MIHDVHPVVLGQGPPLFRAPDVRVDLRPEGARTFGNAAFGGVFAQRLLRELLMDLAQGRKST